MRRLVTWLLDGLPFDPRSRRALDETLLDWAAEASESAPERRWLVELAGVMAVVRTLVLATTRETAVVPLWWLVKRTIYFCVLPAMFVALAPLFVVLGNISALRFSWLLVLSTPGELRVVAPLGLLLCLMWRPVQVRVPPAATAVIVAAATLGFLGWILPFTNELFGELYAGWVTPTFGDRLALQLVDEPTFIEITGFAALVGASVVLAEALFRRMSARKLDWIAGVPMFYLLAGGIVSGIVRDFVPGASAIAATAWAQTAAVLLVAVVIQRRTTRDTRALRVSA